LSSLSRSLSRVPALLVVAGIKVVPLEKRNLGIKMTHTKMMRYFSQRDLYACAKAAFYSG
jgi:hypothetical protein